MTMDRIDRVIPRLFDELADPRTPAYLEAAIERASSRPQRPAWTFPGRWLPMQISTSAAPVARVPWRQIGVLALLGILIAVAAFAVAGSRRTVPAPPFGLASNGVIAVERDGDIFAAADGVTGELRPLITGDVVDSEPVFSPDGTKLAFRRATDQVGRFQLMVADANGGNLRSATSEPLTQLAYWSFSPDGTELLVTARVDDQMQVFLLPVAGGEPRMLGVTLPDDGRLEAPSFRPPDGDEILVMPIQDAGNRAIVAVDRATGAMRTIVPAALGVDHFGAEWSPTGDEVLYGAFDPGFDGLSARAHVVAADGTGARPIGDEEGTDYTATAAVSSDGSRAVIVRGYDRGEREQSVIVPIAGDGEVVEILCDAAGLDGCEGDWVWSPDDTTLLGRLDSGGYVIADPATGQVTTTDWDGTGMPAWQRIGSITD